MPKRSRARAYLLLARVSNLPTVWTNVLAAYVIAGAPLTSLPTAMLVLSLFYTAGMFLNDVADVRFDKVSRPDRPIPAGDVSRIEALLASVALLALGGYCLVFQPRLGLAVDLSGILIATIVFYNLSHKGKWYGPILMGACRALVYAVAAASAVGEVSPAVTAAAAVMWAYVIALTQVAKTSGRGNLVPWLIAGICLVDAAMIAIAGAPLLAAVAATGFVATLALQRVVPGT